MRNSTIVLITLFLSGPALAAPAFAPVSIPDHVYAGGWEHFVGGGVAAFDCDGDHLPELYAAGGTNPAMLLRNRSTSEQVDFDADTPDSLAITGVTGAYPLDVDSDGIMDLMVLRVGDNKLLKGQGNCAFTEFDGPDLSKTGDWTTAFSATWEANQNLPTLAFGNYVNRADPKGPFQACAANTMIRPEGDKFGATTELTPGFCALSMLFSDWGRNGRPDLRVSNDRHYYVRGGAEQLWAMEPTPRLYGEADGWRSYSIWGMGIASRDISGDGLPDVFLSSMGDQKLQFLEQGANGPVYRDATFGRGTTAHRPYTGDDGRPSTGWQISFGDVDNDALDDVFIAKGNVEQMIGSAMHDPNNLLKQLPNGDFKEIGEIAGVASMEKGRGAALVDLNDDGLLDLVVVNRRARMEVYRNVTPEAGHWLKIKLHQSAPNLDAVGAWLEVTIGGVTHAREITIGGGHVSGTLAPEHFGLGAETSARLRVIWPDGTTTQWQDVRADQSLLVERIGTTFKVETL